MLQSPSRKALPSRWCSGSVPPRCIPHGGPRGIQRSSFGFLRQMPPTDSLKWKLPDSQVYHGENPRETSMRCRVVGLLITGALGLCVAPLVVEAQPSRKAHRMGFLWNSPRPSRSVNSQSSSTGCPSTATWQASTSPSSTAMRRGTLIVCPAWPPSWSASRWRASSRRDRQPSRQSDRRPARFRS